jgi:predicted flap endonuclease-1-like 5' DNA nuclease
VQSARVEHYKKYRQWLGDGEPPSEITDLRAQINQLQAVSSQGGENSTEQRNETAAETNGEIPIEMVREQAVDLTQAGAVEPSEEGQAVGESPDDLKHIRGVGPALERFLHKRGVFWFSQVATWSHADIDKFEFLLPNFGGRIQRERWVQSARVEHYKKYKQWLGDDGPPSPTPEIQ